MKSHRRVSAAARTMRRFGQVHLDLANQCLILRSSAHRAFGQTLKPHQRFHDPGCPTRNLLRAGVAVVEGDMEPETDELIRVLESFREGDPQEQRETLEFLTQAVDEDRTSYRPPLPRGSSLSMTRLTVRREHSM